MAGDEAGEVAGGDFEPVGAGGVVGGAADDGDAGAGFELAEGIAVGGGGGAEVERAVGDFGGCADGDAAGEEVARDVAGDGGVAGAEGDRVPVVVAAEDRSVIDDADGGVGQLADNLGVGGGVGAQVDRFTVAA